MGNKGNRAERMRGKRRWKELEKDREGYEQNNSVLEINSAYFQQCTLHLPIYSETNLYSLLSGIKYVHVSVSVSFR